MTNLALESVISSVLPLNYLLTLFRLLDRCHNSLSQAIQVETDATLSDPEPPRALIKARQPG